MIYILFGAAEMQSLFSLNLNFAVFSTKIHYNLMYNNVKK